MAKGKRAVSSEIETMVVAIVEKRQSYFIAENTNKESNREVGDEGILEIEGRIDQISYRSKTYLGKFVKITLLCSRRFVPNSETQPADKTALYHVNLKHEQASMMAYFPADVFWGLPRMIDLQAISRVEVRFERPRYGSGRLDSLHFCNAMVTAREPIGTSADRNSTSHNLVTPNTANWVESRVFGWYPNFGVMA